MRCYRASQIRIDPLLAIIGTRCPWCISASGSVSVLSLVKSRVTNNYLDSTLTSHIDTALNTLKNVYNNYLDDIWIANLSSTVSSNDFSQYSSKMSTILSELNAVQNLLDSAFADVRDAIGMIDDIIDLVWTQKVCHQDYCSATPMI